MPSESASKTIKSVTAAQALHGAHRHAGQAHELQEAQPRRGHARDDDAGQQPPHARPVEVVRQQVVVDQLLAQQGADHFQAGREDQP